MFRKPDSPMDSTSPRRYQENHPQHQLHQHPTLLPSPRHSHSSNSSCSSSTNSNGGHGLIHSHPHSQQLLPPLPTTPTPTPTPTPLTPTAPPPQYPPKPITRSESTNPYPTTFVQADTSSFKQVVQMLTGSSETAKQAAATSSKPSHNNHTSDAVPSKNHSHSHIPPIKTMPKKQQSGFKLYERRNSLKNLNINPLLPVFSSNTAASPTGFSPRKPEVLSPSILDFPALVLSPVTPLIPDPFDRSAAAGGGYRCSADTNGNGSPTLDMEAEEKAIKEKGFYLHPSPATTPGDSEPRLLPLFPTTSPKASGSSSS